MPVEFMLLAPSCICLLIIVAQSIKIRRLAGDMHGQEQALMELKQEMGVLLSCERGMGDRIKQQQQQVRCVIERQDKLEISDVSNTSYKQAMVLLQKGASTDELIDACDLSRGELELLSRLKIASESTPTTKAA
jgi:Protein of unknown function (DUF2802)